MGNGVSLLEFHLFPNFGLESSRIKIYKSKYCKYAYIHVSVPFRLTG